MARSSSGLTDASLGQTLKAMAPFIGAQCLVTAAVFAAPWTVHQLDVAADMVQTPQAMSKEDAEQLLREFSERPVEPDPTAEAGQK